MKNLERSMEAEPKRKRGRPPKPVPRIDATPERIARAIFAAAKPPDPSRRKPRRGVVAASS